ncbi:hypothetical protein U1Q18_018102 [Sarracenia purpurea var. burkii]
MEVQSVYNLTIVTAGEYPRVLWCGGRSGCRKAGVMKGRVVGVISLCGWLAGGALLSLFQRVDALGPVAVEVDGGLAFDGFGVGNGEGEVVGGGVGADVAVDDVGERQVPLCRTVNDFSHLAHHHGRDGELVVQVEGVEGVELLVSAFVLVGRWEDVGVEDDVGEPERGGQFSVAGDGGATGCAAFGNGEGHVHRMDGFGNGGALVAGDVLLGAEDVSGMGKDVGDDLYIVAVDVSDEVLRLEAKVVGAEVYAHFGIFASGEEFLLHREVCHVVEGVGEPEPGGNSGVFPGLIASATADVGARALVGRGGHVFRGSGRQKVRVQVVGVRTHVRTEWVHRDGRQDKVTTEGRPDGIWRGHNGASFRDTGALITRRSNVSSVVLPSGRNGCVRTHLPRGVTFGGCVLG